VRIKRALLNWIPHMVVLPLPKFWDTNVSRVPLNPWQMAMQITLINMLPVPTPARYSCSQFCPIAYSIVNWIRKKKMLATIGGIDVLTIAATVAPVDLTTCLSADCLLNSSSTF